MGILRPSRRIPPTMRLFRSVALAAISYGSAVLAAGWSFEDATLTVQGKGAGVGGSVKESLTPQSALPGPVSLASGDTLKIALTTTAIAQLPPRRYLHHRRLRHPPNLIRRLGSPGRQRLAPRHRIRQSSPRTRLIPRQHPSDGGGLLLVLHGLESIPDAAGGGCGGRVGLCEREPRIVGSAGATLGWTAVKKALVRLRIGGFKKRVFGRFRR